MEISQSALDALYTAVKLNFNEGRNSYQPKWQQLATLVNSTTAQENYAWLGEFSRLKKWVGDRTIEQMAVHNYAISNVKYEATEGIKAEYIEDDTYGVLMPKFSDMGYAAATHPDELVFSLLASGFTSQCYDSQNFFALRHPVISNGKTTSVSNVQLPAEGEDEVAPWFLLDTSRPLKPLIFQRRRDYRLQAKTDAGNSDHVFMKDEYLYGVDARVSAGFGFWQQAFASKVALTEGSFNAAVQAMMSFKSDQGRPLGIVPNLLVCGPTNRAAAKKVIEAEQDAAGASNINFKAVEVMVVPWLA